MGAKVPLLGSLTGTINLAVYVGDRKTGVVGRIQFTLGSNMVPGINLNGQFLLEINTFTNDRTIQTFDVAQTGGDFNGFVRRRRRQPQGGHRQIATHAGFKLVMCGELAVGDTVKIKGEVLFRIELAGANPAMELVVNGKLALDPMGNVTMTDSGFRIDASGLVARVEVGLKVETAFQGFCLGAGSP